MAHPGIDFVRELYADLKDHTGTLLERRAAMDAMVGGPVAPPPGIAVTELTLGGRPAEALTPTPAPTGQAVLYLHGGGYCMGGCNRHGDIAGRLALASGVTSSFHSVPAGTSRLGGTPGFFELASRT